MAENFFGITDTGRVRDNNEDTFIAEKVLNNNLVAACVIDGVGGYEGGEVAAAIAKQTILSTLQSAGTDLTQAMRQAFLNANLNIYNEKLKGKNQNMACVATLALVSNTDNLLYYAHVGDTRLYLLRDDTLVKITKDHSFVGFLEDSGRLNEKTAMSHPKRNEINKALGFDPQIELQKDYIETGESPFLPGDIILLCSDGLTDMVDSATMASVLTATGTLQQKAQALIDAANDAGGKDNVTVVLVQNVNKPVKLKATKPVSIVKKKDTPNEEAKERINKQDIPVNVIVKKRSNWLAITILSLICITLAAALIWLYFNKENKKETPLIAPPVGKNQNAQEVRLAEAINTLQSDTLLLDPSIYGQNISLTDTLWIRKDSFVLKASGNLFLMKDTAVTGFQPIIAIAESCRYILFDSIGFKNVDIHVLAANKNPVRFKNVRLVNSKVQTLFQYGDSVYLTGKIWDTSLITKKSLPK